MQQSDRGYLSRFYRKKSNFFLAQKVILGVIGIFQCRSQELGEGFFSRRGVSTPQRKTLKNSVMAVV